MEKTLPIGFWNYPSVLSETAQDVEVWAKAGITLTMSPTLKDPDSAEEKERMLSILDACEAHGLRLILRDARTDWQGAAEHPAAYRERFRRAMADYGHHPAAWGFLIGDEPGNEAQFEDCRQALQIQREEAPQLTGFLNFNPYFHGVETQMLGGRSFFDWGVQFVNRAKSPLICYDCYWQLDQAPDGQERYFENLYQYGRISRATNTPLWTTLLCTGHFRYRCPSEDDLRWQLSTAVASGCQGILWFKWYGDPTAQSRNYRMEPIDEFGEPTETYVWLSRVLRRFNFHYGELLTQLRFQASYHFERCFGGFPAFQDRRDPLIWQATSDHHVPGILSCFTDGAGRRYVMLVNNSPFESDRFIMILSPALSRVLLLRQNGRQEENMKESHWDAYYKETEQDIRAGVWLAPGQFELFRLEEGRNA